VQYCDRTSRWISWEMMGLSNLGLWWRGEGCKEEVESSHEGWNSNVTSTGQHHTNLHETTAKAISTYISIYICCRTTMRCI
jgi:hypothetical protein